jgi:parallel beta-helix repeat protein
MRTNITNIYVDGSSISYGIYLVNSFHNRVVLVDIGGVPSYNTGFIGLSLTYSGYNRIVVNEFHNLDIGIELRDASFRNRILLNNFDKISNTAIISLGGSNSNSIHDNTISNSKIGCHISEVVANRVQNNIFTNNDLGISFVNTIGFNTAINNTITDSKDNGIVIDNANYTNINSNTISNTANGFAIDFRSGSDSSMIWNNLINNTYFSSQANDSALFTHINNNFFSEITDPDTDLDNFVDAPYRIEGTAGNFDYQALTMPNYFNDFSVTYPPFNEIISGDLQIEWIPASDTYNHDFNYTIYYSSNGGFLWNILAFDVQGTSYVWDTTTVEDGDSYAIMVIAGGDHGVGFSRFSEREFIIENNPYNEPEAIYVSIDPHWEGSEVGDVVVFRLQITSTFEHDMNGLYYAIELTDPNGNTYLHYDSGFDLPQQSTVIHHFEVHFDQLGYYEVRALVFDDMGVNWGYVFGWEVYEKYTENNGNPPPPENREEDSSTTPSLSLPSFHFYITIISLGSIMILVRKNDRN